MSKEFSTKRAENKESVEESLKKNTIGLVHLDDFKLKRKQIEEQAARDAAGTSSHAARPKKKSKTKKSSSKLSFADGDVEDGDDIHHGDDIRHGNLNIKKLSKNPQVDTSFLPDRDRDISETSQREILRIEFLEKQEQIKSEELTIHFAFFDGTSHPSSLTCNKGDTFTRFLDKSRQNFTQLRSNHVDNLMLIKNDLILPPHYSFYDFQVNQTRSKQGELFNFTDADSPTKVVQRTWYHNNKHIFPASKWEQFEKPSS
ncbi:hypothetical protein E3P81_01809 [Wallemia ichthyophaga]|nr:hypothetical protein E3P97_01808 [Wallemia ichthyophaga]TIB05274.1 hypothetical protein E3P96_01236 [Wallemia ichthyophaga]TIB33285.1 hypothetical protein E3P85_01462 [Wallemia ichthyophaga]TIB47292.1 hypothetical protein E3P82_01808 [Wallemia ichthyophaga]TIB51686.1 hypothetical protein E3P81_01809 [Wallemia ichthyophaga]